MRWWGRKQGEGAGVETLSFAALSDSASFLAAAHAMSAWGHLDLQLRRQRRKAGGKTLIFKSIGRDSWTGAQVWPGAGLTLPFGAVRGGEAGPPVSLGHLARPSLSHPPPTPAARTPSAAPRDKFQGWGCFPFNGHVRGRSSVYCSSGQSCALLHVGREGLAVLWGWVFSLLIL